jgi:hypothetical protein
MNNSAEDRLAGAMFFLEMVLPVMDKEFGKDSKTAVALREFLAWKSPAPSCPDAPSRVEAGCRAESSPVQNEPHGMQAPTAEEYRRVSTRASREREELLKERDAARKERDEVRRELESVTISREFHRTAVERVEAVLKRFGCAEASIPERAIENLAAEVDRLTVELAKKDGEIHDWRSTSRRISADRSDLAEKLRARRQVVAAALDWRDSNPGRSPGVSEATLRLADAVDDLRSAQLEEKMTLSTPVKGADEIDKLIERIARTLSHLPPNGKGNPSDYVCEIADVVYVLLKMVRQ